MPEQQNIEWKENWRSDYFEWISAFANAKGGSLFIGIDDKGKVVGINNYEKLLETLPNQIRDLLGVFCEVNHLTKEDKNYLEIVVPESSSPISYKGKFYKRSGSTTQTLNGSALQDFLLDKSNLSWDEIILDKASFDDIDVSAIEAFKLSAINTGRIPSINKKTDTKEILKKLNLITKEGGYTRAAILLFGKEPTRFFSTAYLKIGKFRDSSSELQSQDVIESNAFELADKTIEILDRKYIVRNISYEGLSRIETPEYPFEAIRELLFNAIIHKKYNITPITVRVYDDRISICNVGILPEELTLEDLKKPHESYPRNKLMAKTFYKGGHIESWGRGTIKVIEECEKHGLPEPLIEERSGGIWVTIFKDIYSDKYLSNLDLNERQRKAVNYVKSKGEITSSIYSELYDVTDRTALRDLKELIDLNIIKKQGDRKTAKYLINIEGYNAK